MAKQLLRENIVMDLVQAVFNAIVRQRNKAIQKAAEKDPEFQQIVTQLQKGHDELVKWAEEKAKSDPRFAQQLQKYKDLGMV